MRDLSVKIKHWFPYIKTYTHSRAYIYCICSNTSLHNMVVYDQGPWPRSYKIKVPMESKKMRYAHFLTYSDSKILKLIQKHFFLANKHYLPHLNIHLLTRVLTSTLAPCPLPPGTPPWYWGWFWWTAWRSNRCWSTWSTGILSGPFSSDWTRSFSSGPAPVEPRPWQGSSPRRW